MSDVEEHLRLPRPSQPMPPTIIAAVVLVSYYVLIDLFDSVINGHLVGGVVSVGISVLILIGLARRHALAWQWGLFMPLLAALNAVAALAYAHGTLEQALYVSVLAVDLAIPVLLTVAPSRRYFGIACPRCGSLRTGASNFLFTGHRCKRCHVEWRYE
jgi:hypothetical protein